MALKAICPNCNVENDPSLVNCEVCKTALGALLVGEPGKGPIFFGASLGASLGMYVLCWVFGLHPVMLLVSVFYGTLLTSYFAKHNVVWASALGGLTAMMIAALRMTSPANHASTIGRSARKNPVESNMPMEMKKRLLKTSRNGMMSATI